MLRNWNNWKLSTKWTIAFSFLIVIVSASMTFGVYFQMVYTQRQAFRDRLVDILNFASPLVDGDYHTLIKQPVDENGPFYRVIDDRLQSIQKMSQIINQIYTVRFQENGQLVYIVDASKQNHHAIGEPYGDENSNNLISVSGPAIEATFQTDTSGTYLKGFTPIYNQFGEVDAYLGIQINAATILSNEDRARRIALLVFLATVPLSLFIGYRFARILTAPVDDLVKGAERVAQGDLNTLVPVISQDELGILSTAFNHMTNRLKQSLGGLEQEISKYQWAEKVQDAIFRISQTVISTNSMDEMFHSIRTILRELIPVENFFIALYDDETNAFSFPYYIDQYDPPPKSVDFHNGLTEYVIRTKRPLFIKQDEFQKLFEEEGIQVVGTKPVEWLGVPLMVEEKILGVVAVQSYSDEIHFDKENLSLMEFISTQIALAIVHKKTVEQVQKSNQRYRVLFEDSPTALLEEDFSGVKLIIDRMREQGITDFRSHLTTHPEILADCAANVHVLDVNKATLTLYGANSKEEMINNLSTLFYKDSYVHFREEIISIAEGKTEFTWDGSNQTLDGRHIEVSLNWSVVPGNTNDLSKVIVSVQDITERRITEKRLLYISSHDALTKLYNRAYFDEEMGRLERGRHFPVSVIMLDVDKLKKVNDQDGHAAGDAILQQLATVLNSVFRAEDVIARIGGDEFAVLLPGISASGTAKAIQRIRLKVQRKNMTEKKNLLSLSIGGSTAEKPGTLSAALIQADTNMYLDKYSKQESMTSFSDADSEIFQE
jgi:diguanylate cyclase (GGDEF)-like protein/PAS domain S-box-containing protein